MLQSFSRNRLPRGLIRLSSSSQERNFSFILQFFLEAHCYRLFGFRCFRCFFSKANKVGDSCISLRLLVLKMWNLEEMLYDYICYICYIFKGSYPVAMCHTVHFVTICYQVNTETGLTIPIPILLTNKGSLYRGDIIGLL